MVRPTRSCQRPVSRADSCTCPHSATAGCRSARKRRIATLPMCRSSGAWSTIWPSRAARSRAGPWGGAWKRNTACARSSAPRQVGQIPGDGGPAHHRRVHVHGPLSRLRRHAARVHPPAHVVALPILQLERRGRHPGAAIHRHVVQQHPPQVHVLQQPVALHDVQVIGVDAGVIVAEDREDTRIVGRPGRAAVRAAEAAASPGGTPRRRRPGRPPSGGGTGRPPGKPPPATRPPRTAVGPATAPAGRASPRRTDKAERSMAWFNALPRPDDRSPPSSPASPAAPRRG